MIVSLCKTYWMFSVQVSRELKDLCFTLYLVRYQLKNHRVSILTAKRENMGCKKTQTSPSWFNQQLGRINSIKVLLPGTLTNFAAAKCFSPQNQRMTIDNQKKKSMKMYILLNMVMFYCHGSHPLKGRDRLPNHSLSRANSQTFFVCI